MPQIGICDTTKRCCIVGYIFQVRLGAVWLQKGKPDKVRYAIIEKEMLEIVCEYEILLLFKWQKVSKQIRFMVTVYQITHPVDENVAYNVTVILKSSTFQAKRVHLQMLLAESTLKMRWNKWVLISLYMK